MAAPPVCVVRSWIATISSKKINSFELSLLQSVLAVCKQRTDLKKRVTKSRLTYFARLTCVNTRQLDQTPFEEIKSVRLELPPMSYCKILPKMNLSSLFFRLQICERTPLLHDPFRSNQEKKNYKLSILFLISHFGCYC